MSYYEAVGWLRRRRCASGESIETGGRVGCLSWNGEDLAWQQGNGNGFGFSEARSECPCGVADDAVRRRALAIPRLQLRWATGIGYLAEIVVGEVWQRERDTPPGHEHDGRDPATDATVTRSELKHWQFSA
jgi:hypothetical protein